MRGIGSMYYRGLTLLFLISGIAFHTESCDAQYNSGQLRKSIEPVYIRPTYDTYHQCGGACLKSGLLTWFCEENTGCALNCAIGPPVRRCVTSGSVIEDFRILN